MKISREILEISLILLLLLFILRRFIYLLLFVVVFNCLYCNLHVRIYVV